MQEAKPILICTNIPDGNSPMILSYINYLLSDKKKVVFSSKISNLNFPKEVKVSTTNYLKYKYHLILYPIITLLIIFVVVISYARNWAAAKKNFSITKFTKDILASTKYYVNHLAINVFHFYQMVKNRPQYIVCICAGSTAAARWYGSITNTRFAYSLYEIYPNQLVTDYYFRRRLKANIEMKGCKAASTIFIPYSDQFIRLIRLRYGIKDIDKFTKLVSLPKEVDIPVFKESSFPIKFYYHGSFDNQRGLDIMIDAIRNFSPNKAVLYLRGFGPLDQFLKEKVSKDQLGNHVTFLPPLPPDQLAASACEYDVGLSLVKGLTPNNRFLIGFKALDYICAGIASFVPNNYVLGTMVKSRNIGVSYDKLDVKDLSISISKLLNLNLLDDYKKKSIVFAKSEINFLEQRNTFLNRLTKSS